MRVTNSDNGITNAIDIFRPPHGQVGSSIAALQRADTLKCFGFLLDAVASPALCQIRLVCSNNDEAVRMFDAETFQLVRYHLICCCSLRVSWSSKSKLFR